MIPFADFAPDRAEFGSPMLDAKNVIIYGEKYVVLPSMVVISDALASAPVAAYGTPVVSNGDAQTFVATGTRIYRRTDMTWADVSRSGGYTASSPALWQFAQFDQYIFAASYGEPLQYADLSTAIAFGNVTSGPKARRLARVRDFLVVGDIDDPTDGEKPYRVRWCGIGAPLSWPAIGSATAFAQQSDQQDLDSSGGLIQAIVGTEWGIVFQERCITRMAYIGSPAIFQFDIVDRTRGLIGKSAYAVAGRRVFFASEDGFFVTDGTGESVPIGKDRVDKYFLSNYDPDEHNTIYAAHDIANGSIIWSFVLNSGSREWLIYNYLRDKWTRADRQGSILFEARSAGYTLESLDSLSTSLDALTVSLDDEFYSGGGVSFATFDANNKLNSLTGTGDESILETGEFRAEEGSRQFVSGVRALINGGTQYISLGKRETQSGSVSWTSERQARSDTGVASFRSSGFFHRIKCRITGDFTDAVGVDAEMQPESGR